MNLNELYDVQTVEVMKRTLRRDSSAIDVGAHGGTFLKEMLAIAPDGHHLAFEPLPSMFSLLEAEYGQNAHVALFNVALSDTNGDVEFQHVMTNPAYSGLKKRRYDRADETVEAIRVRAARLDDLVSKQQQIRFMKIDVEGAELQILRGAVETIARCKPAIVFEHGLGASDYYGTTPDQVYDLLVTDLGLELYLMSDWLGRGGDKCLDRVGFCDEFYSGRNYYFLAA